MFFRQGGSSELEEAGGCSLQFGLARFLLWLSSLFAFLKASRIHIRLRVCENQRYPGIADVVLSHYAPTEAQCSHFIRNLVSRM